MEKNNKKIIIALSLSVFLTFIIYFVFYFNFTEKDLSKSEIINSKITLPEDFDLEEKSEVGESKKETVPQIVAKPLSGLNLKVSLAVLDKTYSAEVKEGSTVYDLMKELQNKKENNFIFKYKEYLSLGVFIEEINGIKGRNGKYWIYYVNNNEASVGVSKYVLREGDSILWKQE